MSAFIEEHRERFGVEPICETLGVSASAYYHRATGQRSARQVEDERLLGLICELHARNYYAYGSRRMWKALLRSGERVGRDRVARLMNQNAIQGAKRRGKPWRTTKPNPGAQRSPDLVEREFAASRPDELWFADFTYLRCWEGLVFFSFVIDAYSRKVVGWQFAPHMRTTLVLDALRMALHQRQPGADVGLVHHSDAGSQYTSIDYSQTLDDAGVLASIGTVGDAYDNASAESFVEIDTLDRQPRVTTRTQMLPEDAELGRRLYAIDEQTGQVLAALSFQIEKAGVASVPRVVVDAFAIHNDAVRDALAETFSATLFSYLHATARVLDADRRVFLRLAAEPTGRSLRSLIKLGLRPAEDEETRGMAPGAYWVSDAW